MPVSRIVWRLWDEILNARGKREFVEFRKYAIPFDQTCQFEKAPS